MSEDERPVRREYDNCQLVRWVLREKGVRLPGPPPATLIVAAAFDFRARHAADPGVNAPAEPQAVAETLAFLAWAVEHSARHR